MPDENAGLELGSLLKKAELFSTLREDDLSYIADRVDRVELSAGELLFARGERARRFFVVRSGEVGVYRKEEGAAEREMARYVAGDVIGDFDFAVGSILDATARARAPSELVAFPRGELCMQDIARENPDVASRILLRSLSMISSRLRSTQRLISENSPWIRELRRRIYTDPATGLWSRAFLDEELPGRLEGSCALLMIKPDRFKELTDSAGHTAGDEAMTLLAGILEEEIERRGGGWALRLRSNETALVLPGCDSEEAISLAARLSEEIGRIKLPAFAGFAFTTSMTLALWPEEGNDWRRLVEEAYGLLTRAWKDGGSRLYRIERARMETEA
jgi:diguanylate cyclase (GGDEF)-like protein